MRNQLTRQAMMRRQQGGNTPVNFQNLNRGPAFNRRDAFINAAELESSIERDEDPSSGSTFRFFLFSGLLCIVLLLMSAKLYEEKSVAIPQIGRLGNGGAGSDSSSSSSSSDSGGISAANQEQINEMLAKAGVDAKSAETLKEQAPADGAKETRQQRDERLLRKFEARKKMRNEVKKLQEELDREKDVDKTALVNFHNAEQAVAAINAEVDVELYGTLGADTMDITQLSDKEIGKMGSEKKEEIEKEYADKPELKEMHLAHLHDAVETLRSKDGRSYYLMYGKLPPEQLKHVKATHGGWGQELALKTFRNRLIMSILQHFDAEWLDFTVIGVVIGIGYLIPMIFTVPKAIEIAQSMVDEMERMEDLDKVQADKDK